MFSQSDDDDDDAGSTYLFDVEQTAGGLVAFGGFQWTVERSDISFVREEPKIWEEWTKLCSCLLAQTH